MVPSIRVKIRKKGDSQLPASAPHIPHVDDAQSRAPVRKVWLWVTAFVALTAALVIFLLS